MIERTLHDILEFRMDQVSELWKMKVRGAEHLKCHNALSDSELSGICSEIFPIVGKWFLRSMERRDFGAAFVTLGKKWQKKGFPLSEIFFSMMLWQKSLLDYLLDEVSLDSTVFMYSVIDINNRIAEAVMLGLYYLVKGYLEQIYVEMNASESLSHEVLKRYFKDDFFFKDKGLKS
jgi:hypothetical protein